MFGALAVPGAPWVFRRRGSGLWMENRGCARGLFHSKGAVDFRIVFPHVAIMPVVRRCHRCACACVCVCLVRMCVVRTSAPIGPNLVPVVCMCMRVGGAWGLPVSSCGAPRKIYEQRPAPFRTCCLVVWVAMFGAAYEATAPLGHPMNRHDFHCIGRFAMTHGFVGLSPGCSGRSPWQGRSGIHVCGLAGRHRERERG